MTPPPAGPAAEVERDFTTASGPQRNGVTSLPAGKRDPCRDIHGLDRPEEGVSGDMRTMVSRSVRGERGRGEHLIFRSIVLASPARKPACT